MHGFAYEGDDEAHVRQLVALAGVAGELAYKDGVVPQGNAVGGFMWWMGQARGNDMRGYLGAGGEAGPPLTNVLSEAVTILDDSKHLFDAVADALVGQGVLTYDEVLALDGDE